MFFLFSQCFIGNFLKQPACVSAGTLYDNSYFNFTTYPYRFTKWEFKDSNNYIGKGFFSIVRKRETLNGTTVAVKKFKIFDRKSLIREMQTLRALNDTPNVVHILGLTGNYEHPSVVYSYHQSKNEDYLNMSLPNFKWFLKHTLTILKDIHARGVIHNDMNIGNILFDLENKSLTLIDFGLADFYRPEKHYKLKGGMFRIQPPEFLVDRNHWDCGVDIWSLGITCLDLVLGIKGNYLPKDDRDSREFMNRYFGKQLAPYLKSKGIKIEPGDSDLFELAMPGTEQLITKDVIDLIGKMLTIDPKKRITARDALKHPLFNGVD